ncbi:hypothetical protein M514_28364, partial [Trichuris suis]
VKGTFDLFGLLLRLVVLHSLDDFTQSTGSMVVGEEKIARKGRVCMAVRAFALVVL